MLSRKSAFICVPKLNSGQGGTREWKPKDRQVNQGERSPLKLGINGLGRIGKLSVWHHIARGYFSGLVINIGREAGGGLEDIAGYIERDSTYGYLGQYLYGHKAGRVIENLNEEHGTFEANGIPVTVLRKDRNPKDLPWRSLGVPLVVDATGKFLDPTAPPDQKNGSIQGHLEAGAKKVIVSAPFKIKEKGLSMPQEAVTLVIGINDDHYHVQPAPHDFGRLLHHDLPGLHGKTLVGLFRGG